MKDGYMIAILGNDGTRDELLGVLDSIENAAVRFVAGQAIDHLSPKGSQAALPTKLQRRSSPRTPRAAGP